MEQPSAGAGAELQRCLGAVSHLVQEVADCLVVITAGPGLVVRAGGKPVMRTLNPCHENLDSLS